MLSAFNEASKITVGLVMFPVLLLLVGVAVDRVLATTPLFIFIGIIAGVGIGIYQAVVISNKSKSVKKSLGRNSAK